MKNRGAEAIDSQEVKRDKELNTEADRGGGVDQEGGRGAEREVGLEGEEAGQGDGREVDLGGERGAGREAGGGADHEEERGVGQRNEEEVVQRKGKGVHPGGEGKAVISRRGLVVDQEAKKKGRMLTNIIMYA